MDDGAREIQQEIGRLRDRFFAAVLVDIFTRYCERESGLEEMKKTGGGHMAVYWALELNKLAHLCFVIVMIKVIRVPVTLESMRRILPDVNTVLVLGFICLSLSLSFLAYLQWFVLVG